MEKLDFKAADRAFYAGKPGQVEAVTLPEMQFLAVEGAGDPNRSPAYTAAVEALYGLSYGLKFLAKARLGKDHVVGPLEGLWWAEDVAAFTQGQRDDWRWTMMIRQPGWITEAMVAEVAVAKGMAAVPRLMRLEEGLCLQALHLGPYAEEGPLIARIHAEIAARGMQPIGHHHEIYLSDPRRGDPAKLRTILRQPMGPVSLTGV